MTTVSDLLKPTFRVSCRCISVPQPKLMPQNGYCSYLTRLQCFNMKTCILNHTTAFIRLSFHRAHIIELLDLATSRTPPSIKRLLKQDDGKDDVGAESCVELLEHDWWVWCHAATAAGTLSSRCASDWGRVSGCGMLKWPNVPWQLSSHFASRQAARHMSLPSQCFLHTRLALMQLKFFGRCIKCRWRNKNSNKCDSHCCLFYTQFMWQPHTGKINAVLNDTYVWP